VQRIDGQIQQSIAISARLMDMNQRVIYTKLLLQYLSSNFRCSIEGESFSSLQKLTGELACAVHKLFKRMVIICEGLSVATCRSPPTWGSSAK